MHLLERNEKVNFLAAVQTQYTYTYMYMCISTQQAKATNIQEIQEKEELPCSGKLLSRKLLQISRRRAFRGENVRGMLKNFHGWLSNHEIHERVLPQKFPTMQYTLIIGTPFLMIGLSLRWARLLWWSFNTCCSL